MVGDALDFGIEAVALEIEALAFDLTLHAIRLNSFDFALFPHKTFQIKLGQEFA